MVSWLEVKDIKLWSGGAAAGGEKEEWGDLSSQKQKEKRISVGKTKSPSGRTETFRQSLISKGGDKRRILAP